MSLTPNKRFRPRCEMLEGREMPAAQVTSVVTNGTLYVKGTDKSDTIIVRQNYNNVTVQANNVIRTFTGVKKIDVDAGAGDDKVYIDNTARRTNAPINANLRGGAGNDLLAGGDGNDTIDGGAGNNQLYGGAGNDTITGYDGADLLSGNAGNDVLNGGGGNDSIYGGNGNDTLVGSAGMDYLDGGLGDDNFDGGTGFDTFKSATFDPVSELPSSSDGTDVNQGLAGTCVVLASISSVYESGVDLPSKIRQVGTNLYSIPLYRPGTGWVNQVVKFDGTWTDNDPKPDGDGGYWTLLYQRAYLQEMGVNWADTASASWVSRYGAEFQRADRALLALTGKATWFGSGNNGLTGVDLEKMRKLLLQNKPTIALTYISGEMDSSIVRRTGLIASHAYSILGMAKHGSTWYVQMRNPWGTDGPVVQGANDGIIEVSWADFSQTMMGYSVAV